MGTKDINGVPLPLDGLELWDEEHPNQIYTNELLRERLARGRQPTCGLFGCTNYRYSGWGDRDLKEFEKLSVAYERYVRLLVRMIADVLKGKHLLAHIDVPAEISAYRKLHGLPVRP